jgi:hypothetical protein
MRQRLELADVAAMLALALATLAYLAQWPRDLYMFDEGLYLYEAKRLLNGEVFYRDVFEIITPGAHYVLAGWFAVFGVTLATARALAAVVHAGVVVLVYALCRQVGVRREIAVAAAAAHLAIGHLALPVASPHWFGTLLTLAFLQRCLRPPDERGPLWLGTLVGLLATAQQQKAVVLGVAGAVVLLCDALVYRRAGARALLAALARYAGGIALVAGPFLAALIWSAGAAPVYDALVRFPLEQYRTYNHTPWGGALSPPGLRGPLWLTRALPALVPLTFARAAVGWWRGADAAATRALLVLSIVGACSVGSIAYYPDFVHLGLVASVGLVLAAQTVEWGLQAAARVVALPRAASIVAAAALLGVVAWQLSVNLELRRRLYPGRAMTAIGPVDFNDSNEIALLDALRAELRTAPSRELFAYPFYGSVYLLAEADNPTRFQVLLGGYSPRSHFDEVMAVLEARRVPFVIVLPLWIDWNHDRFLTYVREHYERVPVAMTGWPTFALFRRRPDSPRPAAAN